MIKKKYWFQVQVWQSIKFKENKNNLDELAKHVNIMKKKASGRCNDTNDTVKDLLSKQMYQPKTQILWAEAPLMQPFSNLAGTHPEKQGKMG